MDASQTPELQIAISTVASLVAILLSSLTLGWTIYRDAIRKPKFRVGVAKKTIVQRGMPDIGPYLSVEALNLGPIPNRSGVPLMRKSWLSRRLLDRNNSLAFIYPDYGHPGTTPANERLEVGDRASFAFPYEARTPLRENFVQFGVTDGFGQTHWSSRKEMRNLKKSFREDFPEEG